MIPTRRGTAHTSLVAACVAYLNARGGYAWRNQSGVLPVGRRFVHTGRPGIPDVIGVMPWSALPWSDGAPWPPIGRLIAVECKTGTGRVSAVQRRVHEELRKRGALVLVIRDIAELAEALA